MSDAKELLPAIQLAVTIIGDDEPPAKMDCDREIFRLLNSYRGTGSVREGRALAWRLVEYFAGKGPPEDNAGFDAVYGCFRYLIATDPQVRDGR